LDEYYPMPPDDPHSYRRWMKETFFDHVNVPPQNTHIPDGTIPADEAEEFCARYEQQIRRAGGIDLMVLGIGRTGHVGFHEARPHAPARRHPSAPRGVPPAPHTRRDAASGFFGEETVPHQALTMGVGTILECRRIVLLAFGEHKAPTVQKAVEGPMSESVTAS